MSFAGLMEFLVVIVETIIQLMTEIRIGGIPFLYLVVFFSVMSMVLIIVFRVRSNNIDDR